MIRAAQESDLPALAAAMVRLQEAHVDAFPDVYRRFGSDEARAHMSGLLAQANAFVQVVLAEGVVAGHVVFLVERKAPSLFTHARRFGQIPQLEVAPEFRRRGFGRLLLAECERLATN